MIAELGAVQVEARAAESLGDLDRLGRGLEQLVLVVGERASDVAGHRREGGAGGDQGVDVLGVPVPDLDVEAEFVDAPDPVGEWEIGEDHLRADREPHPISSGLTGRCSSWDFIAASAMRKARRASSPVTGGVLFVRIASVKSQTSWT